MYENIPDEFVSGGLYWLIWWWPPLLLCFSLLLWLRCACVVVVVVVVVSVEGKQQRETFEISPAIKDVHKSRVCVT